MSRASQRSAAPGRFAPIFFALGDETRLAIVAKLGEGDRRSITELAAGTSMTRQAVTKHLRVLQDAQVVRSTRAGREQLFELDPEPLREVRDFADAMSARWDRALARLQRMVEEE
jgi:DNA-binding transcriptional ArsR family regulator